MSRAAGRKPLIAGNWKMHNNHFEAIALTQKLAFSADRQGLRRHRRGRAAAVHRAAQRADPGRGRPAAAGLRGPGHLPARRRRLHRRRVRAGCWPSWAASYVLAGHSERRRYHGEDDALVNAKVKAALRYGITPVLCVGETLEVRQAGDHARRTPGPAGRRPGRAHRRAGGGHGHRLRAGLGDRHRRGGHAGGRPGGVRRASAAAFPPFTGTKWRLVCVSCMAGR